jgi:O-antigen/teichoic acid export membrane protein
VAATERDPVVSAVETQPPVGQRMVEGSFWSGLSYLLSAFSAIIAAPFLIRGLGRAGYGEYVLGLSLVAPLGMMTLGVSAATIRYISEAFAREDRDAAATIVRNSLFLNVLTGIAGVALCLIFRDFLLGRLFRAGQGDWARASRMLLLFAVSWPLSQMQNTLAAVDIARLSFGSWAIKANVTTLLLLAIPVSVAVLTGSPLGTAAARLAAVSTVLIVWGAGVARTLGWRAVCPAGDRAVLRRMVAFSSWQVANDVGNVVNKQAATWVIAARLDTAAVGSMNALASVTAAVSGLISRMTDSLFPGVARLAAQGRRTSAFSTVCDAGRLTSLIVFVPLVSVAWLAGDIGRYLGGEGMVRDAALLLPLFAASTAFSVQSAPLSQFLLGTDGNRWLFPMTLVNGLVEAALTYALAASLGIESVGWAAIAALVVGRVPLQVLSIRSIGEQTLNARHFLVSSYTVTGASVLLCLGAWAAAKSGGTRLADPLLLRVALVVGCACASAGAAFIVAHGWAVARQDFDRVLRLGRLLAERGAIWQPRSRES